LNVVFDSWDWSVDSPLAEDIDGDGISELRARSLHYWFFDDLSNPASPFPEVIFHFDQRNESFLPATARFDGESKTAVSLAQDKVTRIERRERESYDYGDLRGAVFGVVIQMCFSGRESEAWSYFDNHYNRSDRDEKRRLLRKRLAVDPVYRAILSATRRLGHSRRDPHS